MGRPYSVWSNSRKKHEDGLSNSSSVAKTESLSMHVSKKHEKAGVVKIFDLKPRANSMAQPSKD